MRVRGGQVVYGADPEHLASVGMSAATHARTHAHAHG